LKEIINLR